MADTRHHDNASHVTNFPEKAAHAHSGSSRRKVGARSLKVTQLPERRVSFITFNILAPLTITI